jgi:transposase
VPAIPSWLLEPLWDQFAALLPDRPAYHPAHPLGCHKPRIADRIIFEKLIQVLRFGCSYASIADCTCGATTIRERRDEWIKAGIFGKLKQIARESYDRIVGLVLEDLAVDGCIAKAPGGGECAGRSPVDRGKLGMKRSLMVEGKGIPATVMSHLWIRSLRSAHTPSDLTEWHSPVRVVSLCFAVSYGPGSGQCTPGSGPDEGEPAWRST